MKEGWGGKANKIIIGDNERNHVKNILNPTKKGQISKIPKKPQEIKDKNQKQIDELTKKLEKIKSNLDRINTNDRISEEEKRNIFSIEEQISLLKKQNKNLDHNNIFGEIKKQLADLKEQLEKQKAQQMVKRTRASMENKPHSTDVNVFPKVSSEGQDKTAVENTKPNKEVKKVENSKINLEGKNQDKKDSETSSEGQDKTAVENTKPNKEAEKVENSGEKINEPSGEKIRKEFNEFLLKDNPTQEEINSLIAKIQKSSYISQEDTENMIGDLNNLKTQLFGQNKQVENSKINLEGKNQDKKDSETSSEGQKENSEGQNGKEAKIEQVAPEIQLPGNLSSKSISSPKEVENLKSSIEATGLSGFNIEKIFKALENFLALLTGKNIKFDTYLDKEKGLIVKNLKGEQKEKFYDKDKKYAENFKTILENSGYKKGKIIVPKDKKLISEENPFALELDTDGPNVFLKTISGEDYSKKSAKVEMMFLDDRNFNREEVEIKDLKKRIEEYDKKHDVFDNFTDGRIRPGEINIDSYKDIKKYLANDYERKQYLKGIKAGLISDVKKSGKELKFQVLAGDYVSKGEMLSLVEKLNNNPKFFWESYLNKLGISLDRQQVNGKEKIEVNLPNQEKLIYIDNGRNKFIYNDKIFSRTGIEVAGLYPEQIILFAHALKNHISLKNFDEFHYSEIKELFSKNKNLKDLKIFDPNKIENKNRAILELASPYSQTEINSKQYRGITEIPKKTKEEKVQPLNKENKNSTKKVDNDNTHKEQMDKVFSNYINDEDFY